MSTRLIDIVSQDRSKIMTQTATGWDDLIIGVGLTGQIF